MRHHNAAVILPLLVAMAAGCTTMGTGTGSTPSGANAATFDWKSSDGVSGTINATLSGGKTYSGQYFQITKDTTVDDDGTKHMRVVLYGTQGDRAGGVVYAAAMPPFAGVLSDADIADIIDYERRSWGNHGKPVTAAQVAAERSRPQ